MGLNIKNPRVHELARRAARRSGKTQTGAIEAALEQYLRSLDEPTGRAEQRARIDLILRDFDLRFGDPGRAEMTTDDL